jgi:RND family efflux transporter MFP subunit
VQAKIIETIVIKNEKKNKVISASAVCVRNFLKISPSSDGKSIIAELPAKDKNFVKKGDLILRFDTKRLELEKNEIETKKIFAQKNLTRSESLSEVVPVAEIEKAKAEVEVLKAQEEKLNYFIEKSRVIAPFDGWVELKNDLIVGSEVPNNVDILTIHEIGPMIAQARLPADQFKFLHLKSSCKVKIEERTYSGQVAYVSPASNVTGSALSVHIVFFPQPEDQIASGSVSSVDITCPETETSALIPSSAIKYSSLNTSVFVIQENHAFPVQIQIVGKEQDGNVSVVGLTDGQVVAVSGIHRLYSGCKVA